MEISKEIKSMFEQVFDNRPLGEVFAPKSIQKPKAKKAKPQEKRMPKE